MRILVSWDNPQQAELLSLFLDHDGNEPVICTGRPEALSAAGDGLWDVILMAVDPRDFDGAFDHFEALRHALPDCPVVAACYPQDVYRIARFMTHGLRTYLIRDDAGDFVFMLRSILESTVDSVRAERERFVAERLRQEVESVRRLQESIIPNDLRSPRGYQIVARYESSQIQVLGGQPVVMAGGDYYDAFMLDDDSLVLLLGDASGHGMKACMSIMTMHTLIRAMRNEGYRDTAAFVAEVNRRLCEQDIVADEGGFITLLFAILRADTHEFQWTSAGHPSPLLHELEADRVSPLGTIDDGGLPLAIMPDAEYEAHVAAIPPLSRLLLYTDGLEEAFPEQAAHLEFGRAGTERVLKSCRSHTLADTLQALFDASHDFTGGAGRHDDTSVVLLERS